jgi:hypothetical protein
VREVAPTSAEIIDKIFFLLQLVFKDAIKEIQDIFRFERASFVQSRLLSAGPGIDSSNLEKVHFIIGLGIIRESLR